MMEALELADFLVDLYKIGVSQGVEYDTISGYASAYALQKSCKNHLYKGDWKSYLQCMDEKQDLCLQKVCENLEMLIAEEKIRRKCEGLQCAKE